VLTCLFHLFLLYCYYYSVMHVTVIPVSAYMALAFVFGFIQINDDDVAIRYIVLY